MKTRPLSSFLAAASLLLTCCDRSPSGVSSGTLAPGPPPAAEPGARLALEQEIKDLESQEALLRRQIQEDQLARDQAALQGQREALAREKEALAAERAAAAVAASPAPPPRAEPVEPIKPSPPRASVAAEMERDYQMFYEGLAPYGQWIETAEYGYVWQPAAPLSPGWRPYTLGRWVDSDQGWTWVSSEPFGWATYHYGRWALLAGRGWIWVPGDTWAPAWVSWRHSEDLVGWCPLPPETVYAEDMEYGPSIDEDYGLSPETYIFMPVGYFDEPVFPHCYAVAQNSVYFSSTVGITRIVIRSGEVSCGGPRLDWVNRRLARPMTHYRLNRGDDWGDRRDYRPHFENGALSCYAPRVRTSWNEGIRPSRVQGRWDDVKVVRRQDAFQGDLGRRYREEQQERRTRAAVALKEEPVRRLAARHGDWEKLRSRRDQLGSAKEHPSAESERGREAGPEAARGDSEEAARRKLKERQDEVARLRQQLESAQSQDKSSRGRQQRAQQEEVPARQAEQDQRGPREGRGQPEAAAEVARQQEAKQAEARQRQAEQEARRQSAGRGQPEAAAEAARQRQAEQDQRRQRENRGQQEAADAARQQEARQAEGRQRQAEQDQRRQSEGRAQQEREDNARREQARQAESRQRQAEQERGAREREAGERRQQAEPPRRGAAEQRKKAQEEDQGGPKRGR